MNQSKINKSLISMHHPKKVAKKPAIKEKLHNVLGINPHVIN